MVLCFIALPIFLILGIFSVKYRILTKDALDCLGRTITFRKCKSQLDERIKANITGKIMKKSSKVGLFFYKNFQLITTIFLILLFLSLIFSAVGLFNYLKYGNCYGPEKDNYFCPYASLFGSEESTSCNNPELCTNEECGCNLGSECTCGDNETCKVK